MRHIRRAWSDRVLSVILALRGFKHAFFYLPEVCLQPSANVQSQFFLQLLWFVWGLNVNFKQPLLIDLSPNWGESRRNLEALISLQPIIYLLPSTWISRAEVDIQIYNCLFKDYLAK